MGRLVVAAQLPEHPSSGCVAWYPDQNCPCLYQTQFADHPAKGSLQVVAFASVFAAVVLWIGAFVATVRPPIPRP